MQVVVGLAYSRLFGVRTTLVVGEAAPLYSDLSALGAVRNLLLVAYRSILSISIICS